MGSNAGLEDAHLLAAEIVSWLQPSSVIGLGEDTRELLRSLEASGLSRVHAGSADHSEGFDLAVQIGPLEPIPDGLAGPVLMLFPDNSRAASALDALRVFGQAGFSAEFPASPLLAGRAVLFRRGTRDALETRQEETERLVQELRVALAETREQHQEFAERLEGRVALVQSAAMRLQHTMQGILLSRTWRALTAAGGWLLDLQRLANRARFRGPKAPDRDPGAANSIRIVCDEPAPAAEAETIVSGTVAVRGWAIAASGIRRVEIQAGDRAPIEARYGFYRPDVAAHHPEMPAADRSGFRASIDTSLMPGGRQWLTIRAFDAAGRAAESRVPFVVDHVQGYASNYHRWIAEFEKEDEALIRMKIPLFAQQPLVSVLLPVYRTQPDLLERAILSVEKQSYANWEFCIADDGSQSAEVDAVLARHAGEQIRVVRLSSNQGISAASNAALRLARGEFVALLDHDDELSPHALYHFAAALNRDSDADIFYSDEDQIDETGFRSEPFFKPDWSPSLILAENYVNHLMIFRRSLAEQVGGFRSAFDLSQDHDLLLRMSRKARGIVHIPKILYHWRTEVYSTRRASRSERRAIESSRRAIADHLNAAGIAARVEPGEIEPRWRVRYAIPDRQRVEILIPSARAELLERCLCSVRETTDYPDYQIAVLDNSRSDRIERLVRRMGTSLKLKHLDLRHRPFNFSALNNEAARHSEAPLLLFLNDDTTAIHPGWLTAMVELASQPGVGAVGAKLLYPDGTIQHAGVVLGLFDICGHAFKGACADERQYFDFPQVIRDVSAVTGACMMVPADRFRECGGFDEEALPIAYQDVDLCLKLRQNGYRVLFTPHARLYHHEATSKRPEDKDPSPSEILAFRSRWKAVIENDPFYNPNLTREAEDYGYRRKL